MTGRIPFLRPNPARLSELQDQLIELETSNIFTNYGPINTDLEQSLIQQLFGGVGHCLTVCNATIGLMIAVRLACDSTHHPKRRYALMPSFTFAATAHAAIWAGLVPLLCDVDPQTWLPSAASEDELIEKYRNDIAVVIPYATFGNNLDLNRYRLLSERTGIPVVIDAAASLGSRDAQGHCFGAGFEQPVVYSMHATKTFATSEAGLIYCANKSTIDSLRSMGNFGFETPRIATMPGLNSKLSEVAALLALRKLQDFNLVVQHRLDQVKMYQRLLTGWTFQQRVGHSDAHQFVSVLPPASHADRRDRILEKLALAGIGFGTYFDPHLADQPYFRDICLADRLDETQRIARQIISLPLSDFMTTADVTRVCETLLEACR